MKKNFQILLIIIVGLTPIWLLAQADLQAGFAYLDAQEFDKASVFFENILEREPNNKTAQICLGRAEGLGGNTDDALIQFTNLKEAYPNDYEVDMNLAECYMWRGEYQNAIDLYKISSASDAEQFLPNFGLANAYNSIGNPQMAYEYIQRAVEIDPDNQSARVSRKYIILALAAEKRTEHNFDASEVLLKRIFQDFPDDKDAITNLAISYLSDQKLNKARDQYQRLLDTNQDSLNGLIGLSYIALLKNKTKRSLSLADEAVAHVSRTGDSDSNQRKAAINKINALGAAQDFEQANTLLDKTISAFGNDITTDLARARLKVWNQDFEQGLTSYESIEATNPKVFDLIMGKAEGYRGLKRSSDAIKNIDTALIIIPNQPDAMRLRRELYLEGRSHIELSAFQSEDNGDNNALGYGASYSQRIGDKNHLGIKLGNRIAEFGNENPFSNKYVGLSWKSFLNHRFSLMGEVSLNQRDTRELEMANGLYWKAELDHKITKRQQIQIGAIKRLEDYTNSLIAEGIDYQDYYLNYNIVTSLNLGFYGQAMYSELTDGNARQLYFGSIYYNIKRVPLMKLGVNYLQLGFDDQTSVFYFSPESFNSVEGFLQFSNKNNKRQRLIIEALVAFGNQQIDSNDRQNILRTDLSLGYRFSDRMQLIGNYLYSNAAQTTSAGFSFEKYSLKLNIII